MTIHPTSRPMLARVTAVLCFACSAPQPGTGPAYVAPPPSSPATPTPQASKPVSVTLRVECAQSVDLFFGKDPKFGSGRSSRLGGNSVQSSMMAPGDMVWLTDANKNGIGSATVSETTREIRVTCTGISAR